MALNPDTSWENTDNDHNFADCFLFQIIVRESTCRFRKSGSWYIDQPNLPLPPNVILT